MSISVRLGEELQGIDDPRYLLRHLDIAASTDAMAVVTQYFDDSQMLVQTRQASETMLAPKGS